MRLLLGGAMAAALTTLVLAQQPPRPAPRTPAPARPTGRTAAAQPPAREAAVPFRVGETLTYDVSWSQFLVAGTAVTKVAERKPSYGSSAYYVVADGRPVPLVARFYPVYYKMDSLLDAFTTFSQWTSLHVEERGETRESTTRFDRSARRATYEVPGDPSQRDTFTVPADVQDGLAALYSIRGRAFRAGERFTIPVADNGSMYTAVFQTAGPAVVRVPFGDIQAWNLTLTITDPKGEPFARNAAVWISNDARRLPLKLQADLTLGTFVLALRTAQQ